MTVTEFHREAVLALAAEPNELVLTNLVKVAHELGDMVSWAEDIIDKEGRVSTAFLKLQAQARAKFEDTRNENIAALHDEIGNILAAIHKHDEDLTPSTDSDDDNF